MHRLTFNILCILIGMGQMALYSQSFTATVSENNIALNEQFNYTITAENINSGSIELPSLQDFIVVAGPYQQRQNTIINGKQSSSISYTYSLKAKKVGTFWIEPAKITGGKTPYSTKKISIAVYEEQGEKFSEEKNKTTFASLNVSKSSLYPGQELIVSYKLYSKDQFQGYNQKDKINYTGFLATPLPFDRQEVKQETINGLNYYVITLDKAILSPIKKGRLTINPPKIEVSTVVQKQVKTRNPFFPYQTVYEKQDHSVDASPMSINVKEFPANPPKNFKDAVGSFTLSSSISANTTVANNALNFKITLKGTGNLPLIEVPQVIFPEGFEVYDPELKESYDHNSGSTTGSKTWDYLIIPKHAGKYVIPAIQFSYFDPKNETFKEISSNEHPLEVAIDVNDKNSAQTPTASANKDSQNQGLDEALLIQSFRKLKSFFSSKYTWLSIGLFIALTLLFFLFKKKYKQLKSKGLLGTQKTAIKMAKVHLKFADIALKEGNSNRFYEEVYKALYIYLEHKLKVQKEQLSKPSIVEKLTALKIPNSLISQLIRMLDACEMARFSNSSTADQQEVYTSSNNVLQQLEHQIKQKA